MWSIQTGLYIEGECLSCKMNENKTCLLWNTKTSSVFKNAGQIEIFDRTVQTPACSRQCSDKTCF